MTQASDQDRCDQMELVSAYVLKALPLNEARALEAHMATCEQCGQELEALRPLISSFAGWPTEVLRPATSIWDRLLERIDSEVSKNPQPATRRDWLEPDWEQAAPGISCKLLATNVEQDRVTMLVRLAPGVEYPPHTHAGVEELHLLQGELWIDDRKLYPGDYNRAEAGSADNRVWSETGCTCLLITSPSDVLRLQS
jgi:quercetin dioxygenase-like cupin family protein